MTIKHVFADIDGVLVGTKKNINFPQPDHKTIISLIKLINNEIGLSFLTAKASFAALPLIKQVPSDNWHSGDNGATLINGRDLSIKLNSQIKKEVVLALLPKIMNFCCEFFTKDNWFLLRKNAKFQEVVNFHQEILQKNPQILKPEHLKQLDFIKITIIAHNQVAVDKINHLFSSFDDDLDLKWLINPYVESIRFAVITPQNIGKDNIVAMIMKKNNLQPEECLGIGDSDSDYAFMSLCRNQATLANAQFQLKQNVVKSNGYYSPYSVDENGFIDILKHYFDFYEK